MSEKKRKEIEEVNLMNKSVADITAQELRSVQVQKSRRTFKEQETLIEKIKQELTVKEAEVSEVRKNVEVRKQETEVVTAELEGICKNIAEAKAGLEAAKRKKEKAREELERIESLWNSSNRILKKMKKVALVHPSATIYQIFKHQCEEICVSEADRKFFENLEKRTDGIFPIENFYEHGTDTLLRKIPIKVSKKCSKAEIYSIITYCDMVAYFRKYTPKEIVLLYNNEYIKDILKLNELD